MLGLEKIFLESLALAPFQIFTIQSLSGTNCVILQIVLKTKNLKDDPFVILVCNFYL